VTTIADRVTQFLDAERGATALLGVDQVRAQAIAATAFYAGYVALSDAVEPIGAGTDLSVSEWALIRPLFLLYVEREAALQLEATRGMGADVFGRSVSEVAGDITQLEADFPRRVFCREVVSV